MRLAQQSAHLSARDMEPVFAAWFAAVDVHVAAAAASAVRVFCAARRRHIFASWRRVICVGRVEIEFAASSRFAQ